jgi:sugar transferase (PEP-CTERM/EpsH1 system associated)
VLPWALPGGPLGSGTKSPCPTPLKILFLSQRVPYPPNRGDKITTWRLIERMSRNHDVHVVTFAHDQGDMDAAENLRGKGFEVSVFRHRAKLAKLLALPNLLTTKPLTLGVFGSTSLQIEVNRLAKSCDLMYAFSSSMGAFMLRHKLPRVMHFAELDSDKWLQYAERTSGPMSWVYRREYKTLFHFETVLANAVDDNIFCTPLEEKIFQERIPGPPSTVIRNGVDLTHLRPEPVQAGVASSIEPDHLIFVGVMDYLPNVEGCKWFVHEILPKIRARRPQVRLSIVGSNPTPEVEQLGQEPGVTVTGFVDDPKDWLRRAAVSIAPLRIARGIQNKVLEAMAMGLPVVGTTSATQGVGGEPGRDFLLEDSVDGQVQAICGLLEDPPGARELGQRGRLFVEGRYDWEVCFQPLDELLNRLGPD